MKHFNKTRTVEQYLNNRDIRKNLNCQSELPEAIL